jgi:hypothetical protein
MLVTVDESVAVGSHLIPLVSCLACTKGSILEVGVGNWSTPFLNVDPLLVRPWKHNKVDSNTLVLWN